MNYIPIVVICLIVGLFIYIRFAPSNIDKWHKLEGEYSEVGDYTGTGWFVAVRLATTGDLARLVGFIESTERTEFLAGSVGEGMITYVSRSRIIGFPDYTTLRIELSETNGKIVLILYGRSRFGYGDWGVNRVRISKWLEQAGV